MNNDSNKKRKLEVAEPLVLLPVISKAALNSEASLNLKEDIRQAIERAERFFDMQVWGISPKIDVERWLENFSEQETPYALDLLSSFFFLNEKMCNTLLRRALHNASQTLQGTPEEKQENWEKLLKESIFSTLDITDVNVTASGHVFCHRAKTTLKIPEAQFMDWEQSVIALNSGGKKYLILLDDFIGSGQQFIGTWTETINYRGENISLDSACRNKAVSVYYTPLVSTVYGIEEIHKVCPKVIVSPGNLIDHRYSAIHKNSIIWREDLKLGVELFLKATSERAGYKDDWAGYEDLALTLAFSHGMPDATLPIFGSQRNGWRPLIEWQ